MSGAAGRLQIGRLVRAADFERVLRSRSRAQSAHFAVHHLAEPPSPRGKPRPAPVEAKLSTEDEGVPVRPVDDSAEKVVASAISGVPIQVRTTLWIGTVVPKRHARRAVTRTLLKRQIHAAIAAHRDAMAAGLWVVRLRLGFERAAFPSAASAALQRAARDELDRLLARCAEARSPANQARADT